MPLDFWCYPTSVAPKTICWELYVKRHIEVSPGKGTGDMSARDEYLLRAAHLLAKAEAQPDAALKDELENMARSYLRLAEQAKRNDDTDIVYETPPPKDRDQA